MRAAAGIAIALVLSASCGRNVAPPRTSVADVKPSSGKGPILVGDTLASPENCGMIAGARPVYPAEAKRARVQGVVRVAYSITKTGEVSDVHVVSGDPRLVPAALAAVAKWRFAPCRPPGMREAVEVRTESDLSFTLNQ